MIAYAQPQKLGSALSVVSDQKVILLYGVCEHPTVVDGEPGYLHAAFFIHCQEKSVLMLKQMIRNLLRNSVTLSGSSRRRIQSASRALEKLECRTLLTGNVNVEMLGRDAWVTGDDLGNSVEIVAESGNLVVRGLAGTTINGSSEAFTLLSGSTTLPHSLIAFLNGGDDTVLLGEGVSATRDVLIYTGSGHDSAGVVGVSVGNWLNVDSSSGSAMFSIQDTTVGRDGRVWSMGGNSVVSVRNSTFGHNLNIDTGNGSDDIAIDQTTVANDLWVGMGGNNDDLGIRNSTVSDKVRVFGGSGDDIAVLDSTTFGSKSWMFMEGGQDGVLLRGSTVLRNRMHVFGGSGSDILEFEPTINAPRLRRYSTHLTTIADSLVESRIDNTSSGVYARVAAVDGVFKPFLTLSTGANSVSESAGSQATTLNVTRTGNTDTDLVVNLNSSVTDKATLPTTVTIPAGSASITLDVGTIDNNIVDADVLVTLTATASGFDAVSTILTVTNDDVATLNLTPVTATVAENAGGESLEFTVGRNTSDLTQPLLVNLTSSVTGRFTVPVTVTIPANAESVSFFVTPVNNSIVDGSADVIVTAASTGFVNDQSTVTLTDDDVATLSASVSPGSISEASTSPATLTITRNTQDTSTTLEVAISLSDTSRLTAPATAGIPAGQNSVTVSLTPVNNDLVDGTATITIEVTSGNFTAASTAVSVTDDDAITLGLALNTNTIVEDAGAESLTGLVTLNQPLADDETVTLTYSNSAVVTGPASVVIPARQTSVQFPLTVVDNFAPNDPVQVTISATSPATSSVQAGVTVEDDDLLTISATAVSDSLVESNATVITRNSQISIAGQTAPGATVDLDTNNDGVFDNGTVEAGVDGSYSVNITLTHDATNNGANTIIARSTVGLQSQTVAVNVHYALGSIVRFDSTQGTFDVELLDTDAPITVQNFLTYVAANAYQNVIVHRNVANFVIQAGDYTSVGGGDLSPVTSNDAIQNEFNEANSNIRGTLSMALLSGQPDSGTNQWFINTVNNSFLDANKHTVFGRVIGDGMVIVDAINNLTPFDLSDVYDDLALGEVPLTSFTPTNTSISGTSAISTGSDMLTGTGTQFTTELQVGDSIEVAGALNFVKSIESDTSLTLKFESTIDASNLLVRRDVAPDADAFVVFTSIGEILDVL